MTVSILFSANGLNVQTTNQKELATSLLKNGYEPVPIFAAEKKPLISEWQCPGGPVTLERVLAQLSAHPDHLSMGLLTRNMPSVDIDLYDRILTEAAREITELHLGKTPLHRFGSKGRMLCYRLEGKPFGKKNITLTKDGKHPDNMDARQGGALVELFGNGQIVGFGLHPNTQKPYRWLIKSRDGVIRSPLTVPLTDLPPVTEAMMNELKADLIEMLIDQGYEIGSRNSKVHDGPPPRGGDLRAATNFTEMIIRLVPSARQTPTGYVNFECPACRCKDKRSGIQILDNGGFIYKCFHANCEYNAATGWQPPARNVGDRVKDLYRLLGGDPNDLKPLPLGAHLKSYSSVSEMMAAFHPTRL